MAEGNINSQIQEDSVQFDLYDSWRDSYGFLNYRTDNSSRSADIQEISTRDPGIIVTTDNFGKLISTGSIKLCPHDNLALGDSVFSSDCKYWTVEQTITCPSQSTTISCGYVSGCT